MPRGRPRGSLGKPKQVLTPQGQEIQALLTQKRSLPSGSKERIVLGRRIKALQSGARKDPLDPSSVEIPSTKPLKNRVCRVFPDTIDNNCPLKDYCLKENKKYQDSFTCFDSVYCLTNGCNFYKEATK